MMRISPKILSQAQALVETTSMPFADIAREVGISAQLIGKYNRVNKWQRPPLAPPRHVLVARLWSSVQHNLESIETQMREGATAAALRDLAVLTKVMRDLAAMDVESPADTAPEPSDMELREAITRRLERMRALDGLAGEPVGEPTNSA